MTVIQRDCHCGSVCIWETVIVSWRGREAGCVCSPWKLGDSIMVLIWHLNHEMVRFCVQFSQHHPLSSDMLYIFLAQTQQRNKLFLSLFQQRNKCHSKQSCFFCPSERHISTDWEHCPARWLIMYLCLFIEARFIIPICQVAGVLS